MIIEIGSHIPSVDKLLKKYSYKGYYYSVEKEKFVKKGKKSI